MLLKSKFFHIIIVEDFNKKDGSVTEFSVLGLIG